MVYRICRLLGLLDLATASPQRKARTHSVEERELLSLIRKLEENPEGLTERLSWKALFLTVRGKG
jgi:hypothetical protein